MDIQDSSLFKKKTDPDPTKTPGSAQIRIRNCGPFLYSGAPDSPARLISPYLYFIQLWRTNIWFHHIDIEGGVVGGGGGSEFDFQCNGFYK